MDKLVYLPENTGALYELKNTENYDPVDKSYKFKMKDKTQISHDTFIFIFELPEDMYLGLNIGHHVSIEGFVKTEAHPEDEIVEHKYTPISHIYQKGKFDILIKVYYRGTHPLHPEGGRLTQWLDNLPMNTEVKMRGPKGRMHYYGDGNFLLGTKQKPIVYHEKKYKKVGMVAGGTGITPIFQVLQEAYLNKDTVEYTLIFGNRTTKDILLKNRLDEFYHEQVFKFNLFYTVDKMEDGWTGLTGYIDKGKVEKYLPTPSDDTLIMLCGRGKFTKKFLTPILIELGHKQENIFIF